LSIVIPTNILFRTPVLVLRTHFFFHDAQVRSKFERKFSWIPVAVPEETKHETVILKQPL